jgi:hypothetical protein
MPPPCPRASLLKRGSAWLKVIEALPKTKAPSGDKKKRIMKVILTLETVGAPLTYQPKVKALPKFTISRRGASPTTF